MKNKQQNNLFILVKFRDVHLLLSKDTELESALNFKDLKVSVRDWYY